MLGVKQFVVVAFYTIGSRDFIYGHASLGWSG